MLEGSYMKKQRMLRLCALCLTAALLTGAGLAAPAAQTPSQENAAPIAENLEIRTYRGVSVGGRLSAVDPEGDAITFQLTTDPVKGTVELCEDGRFVYTPADGKRGKDYFGYRASDSQGNVSEEATVIIRIEKQKTKLTYSDLEGNGAYYAALQMAEDGVFVGERIGTAYVFQPDRAVTRAEFLAMCMQLCDTKLLSGVRTTGFEDDAQIPAWAKPYVSTALISGAVSGYNEAGMAVFGAQRPVTWSEAAVMLNNLMEITNVSAAADTDTPAWAGQAAANLAACGMAPAGVQSDTLTRADAAELLLRARSVLQQR